MPPEKENQFNLGLVVLICILIVLASGFLGAIIHREFMR